MAFKMVKMAWQGTQICSSIFLASPLHWLDYFILLELLESYLLDKHKADLLELLEQSDPVDHYGITVKYVNDFRK